MPVFYNGCDVLLVTSEVEAHPLVVYEAMACGLPVISTDVGDVAENVVNGLNGYVVNTENPVEQAITRIKWLKENDELRWDMGAMSRKIIEARWTWEQVVPQYQSLWSLMR
jgi:glycosyltransferase involved in cell wall biosynthesis